MGPTELIILLTTAGFVLIYYLKRILRKIRNEKKLKMLRRNQARALEILMAEDYSLLEINPKVEINTLVEDRAYQDTAAWDFIVGKGLKRYLVKVLPQGQRMNFGAKGVRERISGQLSLFEMKNLLLVDVERGIIRNIESTSKSL
ncbi:MAG: hypothetical protein GX318_01265 [Clostridia bacterium]|nr:hypothetical protein [Clostridia bacterium]